LKDGTEKLVPVTVNKRLWNISDTSAHHMQFCSIRVVKHSRTTNTFDALETKQ